MHKLNNLINELLTFLTNKGICKSEDYNYFANVLINEFKVYNFKYEETNPRFIVDILEDLCNIAVEKNICEKDIQSKDNFMAHIVDLVMPRPSEVINTFNILKANDANLAVKYLYDMSKNTNYIKTRRIAQNLSWTSSSSYGDLQITINLSKPEKDPKLIAMLKTMPQPKDKYPLCMLCKTNEGFNGNLSYDSRANMRIIPISFSDGDDWYFQYSPYAYFNEHSIILNKNHIDMSITKNTFKRLLQFLDMFPGYFIGSNADLPIVGGSILNHDHYQAGRHSFPIDNAEKTLIKKVDDVLVYRLNWPLSTIRLISNSKEEIVNVAFKYLNMWKEYENKDLMIINSKDNPHNTITPIARKNDGKYELDLILRCNITTDELPLGVFHPHPNLHHIKKENIGLIEAAGLAILPARLKNELKLVCDALEGDTSVDLGFHTEWFNQIKQNYDGSKEHYVYQEVGKVFSEVLACCGVFKETEEGISAFNAFILEI